MLLFLIHLLKYIFPFFHTKFFHILSPNFLFLLLVSYLFIFISQNLLYFPKRREEKRKRKSIQIFNSIDICASVGATIHSLFYSAEVFIRIAFFITPPALHTQTVILIPYEAARILPNAF